MIATPGKLAQGVPREGPGDGTQTGRAQRGTPTARHRRDRHRQATGLRQGAAVVRDRRPQSGRPGHDAIAYRARGQALALDQGRRRRVPGRSPILACPGSYGPGGHAVDSSHRVLTTDQFAVGAQPGAVRDRLWGTPIVLTQYEPHQQRGLLGQWEFDDNGNPFVPQPGACAPGRV